MANDTPTLRDSMGAHLTPAVRLCRLCETLPYAHPGRLCGPCYREINGIVAYVAPVVKPAPIREPVAPKPVKVAKPGRPSIAGGVPYTSTTTNRRRKLGLPVGTPRAEVDTAWAARGMAPSAQDRGCLWPGCDRPHAMHGFCYRDVRRLGKMAIKPEEFDAATVGELWEAHLVSVDLAARAVGMARRGLPRSGVRS